MFVHKENLNKYKFELGKQMDLRVADSSGKQKLKLNEFMDASPHPTVCLKVTAHI